MEQRNDCPVINDVFRERIMTETCQDLQTENTLKRNIQEYKTRSWYSRKRFYFFLYG